MKKLVTFASDFRLNALLCCSATVLLTACGGGLNDTANGQQAQTAAITTSAANGDSKTPNTVDATAAQATDAAAPAATDGAPHLLAMVTSVNTTSSMMSTPTTSYNYYVSPTGSDSAAGTKAAPFKTLARAAKSATRAGTTVWVAPGTYAGGIKTTASGTSSARIYWISTTKWGAKIVPPASSSNNNAWDNRGNYVSIIGFHIDGTNSGSGILWASHQYSGDANQQVRPGILHAYDARNVGIELSNGQGHGITSRARP